jgi:hypothetical protein
MTGHKHHNPRTMATPTPFVFPGSSARNRERNASFDLGPSNSGKRSSSGKTDNDETANLPENPWLQQQRSRHEPLATVQQNQQRPSLFGSSPTGNQNYSSVSSFPFNTSPPNSILRNRKTSRYNNTETTAAANSFAAVEDPVATATGSTPLVLPPTASMTYETARGYGPSTAPAMSKDNRGDSVVGIGMLVFGLYPFLSQLLRASPSQLPCFDVFSGFDGSLFL